MESHVCRVAYFFLRASPGECPALKDGAVSRSSPWIYLHLHVFRLQVVVVTTESRVTQYLRLPTESDHLESIIRHICRVYKLQLGQPACE